MKRIMSQKVHAESPGHHKRHISGKTKRQKKKGGGGKHHVYFNFRYKKKVVRFRLGQSDFLGMIECDPCLQ